MFGTGLSRFHFPERRDHGGAQAQRIDDAGQVSDLDDIFSEYQSRNGDQKSGQKEGIGKPVPVRHPGFPLLPVLENGSFGPGHGQNKQGDTGNDPDHQQGQAVVDEIHQLGYIFKCNRGRHEQKPVKHVVKRPIISVRRKLAQTDQERQRNDQ